MSELDHVRLLLAILGSRWDEAESLTARTPVDPAAFLEVCRETDVGVWVHARLDACGRTALIGDEAMARLAALRTRIRNDNLLLLARNEQALRLLVDAGVKPVALKGLDVMHRLGVGFDERTMDDVDLLVREEQLTASIDALEAAGWQAPAEPMRTHYIRTSHHLPLVSPGPVEVGFEIHWNLVQEERYSVDVERLFARAQPLEVGGIEILRLDDHDAAAHLLLHHFTHYFDRRLKWMIDLDRRTRQPGFSWPQVVERVREWGATAAVGMSLLHLRKIFPQGIPAELSEQLPVAGWRRALTAPLRSGHPLDLFRDTRRRWVQLYLATVLLERPSMVPGWLLHRATRDRRAGSNPLDR
jgi:hypothetical protein